MEHFKNVLYIISYILMTAAVLLAAVFYRQALASILLVFLIVLPFVSIAVGSYGSKHLTVTASAPPEQITEGDEFRIRLHIRNTTFVPLLRCIIPYSFYNSYRKDDRMFTITLAGESFVSDHVNIAFRTSMPGLFTFDADRILISDPLRFRTFTVKNDIHIIIPVMPMTVPVPDMILSKYEGEPADDIPSDSGELTRDIRQLREYRAGDRLKDIHWKASASAGELIVKEYERSVDLMYLLLPEIIKGNETKVLRLYYSLGSKMISENKGFRTAVYHPLEKTFYYSNVSTLNDLDESVYEIMRENASDTGVFPMFMAQNPGSYGIIRICPEGILNT
ncbi:MAG: DUF58 domain-containing protein [Lachnospiraceae bacterium]|nr:DUF58 domain-containing protein [Lachnospiraceae bacterium]